MQMMEQVQKLRDAREHLRAEVGKVIVGQQEVVDLLLLGLLCRGHVLLHGVPGLGKTLMARTLSKTLDLKFKRVQFTPDLMPSDITGTDVIEEQEGGGGHRLKFGSSDKSVGKKSVKMRRSIATAREASGAFGAVARRAAGKRGVGQTTVGSDAERTART